MSKPRSNLRPVLYHQSSIVVASPEVGRYVPEPFDGAANFLRRPAPSQCEYCNNQVKGDEEAHQRRENSQHEDGVNGVISCVKDGRKTDISLFKPHTTTNLLM